MITAEFLETEDSEWAEAPSISIGQKSPFQFQYTRVGLFKFGKKQLLLHVHAEDQFILFKSLKVSGSDVVIGFGEMVHFFNIENGMVSSIKLDGYFGNLYTPDDFGLASSEFFILVASAMYLHHFTFGGEEIWKSAMLGIDGVIVHEIDPPLIRISGEWDPPGGWEPAIIQLENGIK